MTAGLQQNWDLRFWAMLQRLLPLLLLHLQPLPHLRLEPLHPCQDSFPDRLMLLLCHSLHSLPDLLLPFHRWLFLHMHTLQQFKHSLVPQPHQNRP